MPLFSSLAKPGVRIIKEKLNLRMLCGITLAIFSRSGGRGLPLFTFRCVQLSEKETSNLVYILRLKYRKI